MLCPALPCGVASFPACRYIALQRDSRFEGVYSKYLQMFDQLGLVSTDLPYMHFSSAGTPSKYGSW